MIHDIFITGHDIVERSATRGAKKENEHHKLANRLQRIDYSPPTHHYLTIHEGGVGYFLDTTEELRTNDKLKYD